MVNIKKSIPALVALYEVTGTESVFYGHCNVISCVDNNLQNKDAVMQQVSVPQHLSELLIWGINDYKTATG